MIKNKKAFSLIELSIVILVIGILVIGITQGSRILNESKLKSARALTSSSPVNSMPGLVLWLDATDNTTISTGTVASNTYTNAPDDNADVVDWVDRNPQISTAKKELTAPADANRPKYIKNGIGGLPSLQFDGSADYLTNSNFVIASNKTDYTIIAVWKSNSTGQQLVFAQNGGCSGVNAGIYIESGGTGSWGCGFGYDYFPVTQKANISYINIVKTNKNQANKVTIYLNGVTQSGNPTNGMPSLVAGAIAVAANVGGGAHFNGYISEVIVFDRALTSEELTSVKDYLSKKYSIKVS